MNTTDDNDRSRHPPDIGAQLATEAAFWMTSCLRDSAATTDPTELLSWLRRSPNHIRAFLSADIENNGQDAEARAATTRESLDTAARRERYEQDLSVLRKELSTASSAHPHKVPPASGSTRFLSQAIRDGKLTHEQAQEILGAQKTDRRHGGQNRTAGEIAADNGWLTEEEREDIERARHMTRLAPDLLQNTPPRGGLRLAFALQNTIALAVLCLSLATRFDIGHPVFLVLRLLVITVLFGSLIISLLPRRVYRSINRPLVLSAVVLLRNSAVFAAPIAISALLVLVGANAGHSWREILSPVQAPLVTLVLLSTGALAISSTFQARVKDYFEWREDTFLRVESRILRHLHGAGGTSDMIRKELLETAARVLTWNPWMRLSRGLVRLFKGPPIVSIWYLSPNPQLGLFELVDMSTAGAPADVRRILETFRQCYRPSFLDEHRYARMLRGSLHNGIVNRKKLVELESQDAFVSIAGIVSARRQPLFRLNIREWLAIDGPGLTRMDVTGLSRSSAAWLDYRSVIAYPVFSDRRQQTPASVLLAISNVPNGFTDADLATIKRVTRLLGALLPVEDSATAHQRWKRPRTGKKDPYRAAFRLPLEPPNFVTNFLLPLGQLVFGRAPVRSSGGPNEASDRWSTTG